MGASTHRIFWPSSDIAGANAAQWNSVLVHTGVYDPSQGPPSHKPTQEADDVEQAVKWAIDLELKRYPESLRTHSAVDL